MIHKGFLGRGSVLKIAVISDLHFNMWRKNNTFFKHLMEFFDFFIEEVNRQEVEYIVIAGDLFHTKSIISAEMLLKTTGVFKLLNKNCPNVKAIYIIPGNHDIYLRKDSEWNILHIYQEFQKIQVFHSPGHVDLGNHRLWFLPYYRSAKEYRRHLNMIDTSQAKTNILFSHIGVDDFKMLETEDIAIVERSEFIKKDKFKKFDQVFLGHFHGYQSQDNITYVSSPIQSKHGDEFGEHGFIIYDTKSKSYEFIPNHTSPQFLTKKLNMKNLKELLAQDGEGKFIRIVLTEHIPSNKLSIIIDKLKKKNYNVEIKFSINNSMFYDESIASIQNWDELVFNSTEELFQKFLNFVETDLDKDRLYKFITSLRINNNV